VEIGWRVDFELLVIAICIPLSRTIMNFMIIIDAAPDTDHRLKGPCFQVVEHGVSL
jgi:hypothetical protein